MKETKRKLDVDRRAAKLSYTKKKSAAEAEYRSVVSAATEKRKKAIEEATIVFEAEDAAALAAHHEAYEFSSGLEKLDVAAALQRRPLTGVEDAGVVGLYTRRSA